MPRITCPDCKGTRFRLYPTTVIGTDEPAEVTGTCDTCNFKGWIEMPVKTNHRQLTSIETGFLRAWEAVRGLEDRPVMQLRFALPERDYRFDFAWPNRRVAVELIGGIWMKNRNKGHASPKEVLAEMAKLNAASMRGWRVLRYDTDSLRKRPVQIIEEVTELLRLSRVWREEQKQLALEDAREPMAF